MEALLKKNPSRISLSTIGMVVCAVVLGAMLHVSCRSSVSSQKGVMKSSLKGKSSGKELSPTKTPKRSTLSKARGRPAQVRNSALRKHPKKTIGKTVGVKKSPSKQGGQESVVKRPRPVPPRWYRPTYRERYFPPPKIRRLKQLPEIKPLPPLVIDRGPTDKKWISLTFDACSTLRWSRFERRVARTLIRTKTPATLFLGGKWVLDRTKEAKWLASFPFFEIANHAYLHGHLKRVSAKRLEKELLWTQEIIYTVLGVVPTTFRPPYVEFDKRVVQAAAKLGLYTINGDLPSGDPDPNFTPPVLVRRVLREAQHGSIVIMHINKGGHHTAGALPTMIRKLKQRGFTFVTVATMLKALKAQNKMPKVFTTYADYEKHRPKPKKRRKRRRRRKRR